MMAAVHFSRFLFTGALYLTITPLTHTTHQFDGVSEMDCPEQITVLLFNSNAVPWGDADRAFRTIPSEISIRTSSIPVAGLGVFAETFLKKGTWLGEFEGLIIPGDEIDEFHDDTFMFTVYRDGDIHHYLDAVNPETSNWTRFINGARTPEEQNVIFHQCYDKIFYRLIRDVAPGTELLMYYGEGYSIRLGIDTSLFW